SRARRGRGSPSGESMRGRRAPNARRQIRRSRTVSSRCAMTAPASTARSPPRPRGANSPNASLNRRQPAWATRARHGRLPNGGGVEDEIMAADATIREARIAQRNIDRELARLDAQRTANPPRKMEVRIDANSDAGTSATLLVSYTVRGARWSPIYDARLDTGGRGGKPPPHIVLRAGNRHTTGRGRGARR